MTWRPIAALIAGAILLIGPATLSAGDNRAAERAAIVLNPARTQFVLRCGGCHGTLGVSPPRSVPSLKGTAGYFLCTPEGRDYVIRLPNVSRTALPDAALAEVLNFVVFELGEGSAPPGAAPYTAAEVGAARQRPLNDVPLLALRHKLVTGLVRRCNAPDAMLDYSRSRVTAH